jgi:hypothetical protein
VPTSVHDYEHNERRDIFLEKCAHAGLIQGIIALELLVYAFYTYLFYTTNIFQKISLVHKDKLFSDLSIKK